ncbi:MAG: hypothetical protein ACRDQ2_03530 [Gaiellales bacterium]
MSPTEGVLSQAWGIYKTHWRHLLPIPFVVYIAVALIAILLRAILDLWLASLLASIVSLVATFWVQGALVKAVEDVKDGRADLSLAETFDRVRPKLGAIIVAGILAALGIFLGLILFVVPGLVLLTWWILIVPAIVIEDRSAGEAFGRSRELVRGYGWNVFGVIVLTILVVIGFNIVLSILAAPFAAWVEELISGIVGGTLTTPFVVVAWTLLYFRLRDAKQAAATPSPQPV